MSQPENACPLCLSGDVRLHFERQDEHSGHRAYWLCQTCGMVFLDPALRWPPAREKARYDLHQNNPHDGGYREFLNQLATPLGAKLKRGMRGLDYGCGPTPTLALLFEQHGVHVDNYDPFYFPDLSLLHRNYDFLSCSEVIEHFYDPRGEFARLDELMRPGGHLGVMTQVLGAPEAFGTWWYHLDPTHVCFYQRATLDWIARWRNWRVEYPSQNVAIFAKVKSSCGPTQSARGASRWLHLRGLRRA